MLTRLDGAGPLFLQLYRSLRGAILSGKLPAGARLPSTRALSLETGLSRNTVLLAFDQLLSKGKPSAGAARARMCRRSCRKT
jgi:GntR family transcriptional regulator/MocR family aminotransferase